MNALLTGVLFLPLIGAFLVLLMPREDDGLVFGVGILASVVTFLVSLGLWFGFDKSDPGFQFVANKEWVASLGINFKIGIDGISLWLVLLTTFLTPIVILSARRAITKKAKEFIFAFLVLETGMIGAFVALDLFLFYVMWEVMLIPMYFIIGVWGGDRRIYASIKFVIFTMVGSLLMLVAIFYVYIAHAKAGGGYTFDLEKLYNLQLGQQAQLWCFAAFALAFAIKVPVFPLHTWLPDAHVEAPTAGSVILAGVLLKFGIYGFLRFAMPLFPWASHHLGPILFVLGMIGVVYGAITAYVQEDIKKLVAYSSVSHLGFCVMGIFALNAQGIQGAIFTMLSHGLTTSGLFLGIGILYERRHTRKMSEYGGLWGQMPLFAAFFLIITLGSVGLPGLSGFVGEFLALLGSYDAGRSINIANAEPFLRYPQAFTTIAATGVILAAVYLLTMFQKVMFGPNSNPKNKSLPDLTAREIVVFIPIILGIFVMGIMPRPFLAAMEPAVNKFRVAYAEKLRESVLKPDQEAHLLPSKTKVMVPAPVPAVGAPTEPPTAPPTRAPVPHDHDGDGVPDHGGH